MDIQESNLLRNTFILGVGNIGSKILRFFLLPLYAVFLTKDQIGLYDLVLTSILLVEPLITLKIIDGVYRYLIAGDEDKDSIIWTSFAFTIVSSIFVTSIFIIFIPSDAIPYKMEICLLLLSKVFYTFFSESVRGYKKNIEYAVGGILSTAITLFLSIGALVVLEDKLRGLIVATSIAYFLCCVYYQYILKLKIRGVFFNKYLLKVLILYSIPLIPSAINWWAMRLSNRYVISSNLGLESNAVIAISMTLPSIVAVIGQIFYLAWQEKSFLSIDVGAKDSYFSTVYNQYVSVQFLICTLAFLMSEMTYYLIFPSEYSESWRVSYLFFIGAVFNNLSAFLSVGYTGNYNTRGALITSIYGSVANVVTTFLLVDFVGLWAAPVGFVVGFMVLWFSRVEGTKKYFTIKYDTKNLIGNVFVYALSGFYLLVNTMEEKLVLIFFVVLMSVIVNRKIIYLIGWKIKENGKKVSVIIKK